MIADVHAEKAHRLQQAVDILKEYNIFVEMKHQVTANEDELVRNAGLSVTETADHMLKFSLYRMAIDDIEVAIERHIQGAENDLFVTEQEQPASKKRRRNTKK